MIWLVLPVAVYALVLRWRSGASASEIMGRLGWRLGDGRSYLFGFVAAVPLSLLTVWITPWTSNFKGSTIAPFVGASPTQEIIAGAFAYAILATGFPEELFFRGLIAGVFFRRTSFWRANVLQASIFLLPHLLILFLAPHLWPLAICVPLGLGLVAGWLRQASGSIWPAVILHAVPNLAGALAVLNWNQ